MHILIVRKNCLLDKGFGTVPNLLIGMKLFRLLRNRKAFTLIELLIVIALLGALAVGLIGALDPFDQLRKGTDTGTRDLVNQVQTAVLRYFSIKNTFPWCDLDGTNCDDLTTPIKMGALAANAMITAMQDAGELKTDFDTIYDDAKLNQVWLMAEDDVSAVTGQYVMVCYIPTSKAFQADPNTKYTGDSTDGPTGVEDTATEGSTAACKSRNGDATCFWCIR